LTSVDPVLAMVERLSELVDRLCAVTPLMLVVDDLQWADEASLLLWQRLCRTAEQAPLLLVGACRPVPRREELDRLRRLLHTRGGLHLRLGPLPPGDVAAVVASLAGSPAGPMLLHIAERASGNPLYLRELIDALGREHAIHVDDGLAELVD